MFSLSALFQQAGWVPSLTLILIVAVLSTQSALYLSQTMQRFRDNTTFSKRLEFGNTMFYLLPRWGYYFAMFTLCVVFFSQNLANIILTSQVMDYTVLDALGGTCGVKYYPSFSWTCIHKGDGGHAAAFKDSVFGDDYVLSTGYVITLLVCIPLGFLNLDDNIGFQIAGLFVTLLCVGVWVANFFAVPIDASNMPAFPPDNSALPSLLSTILFNYGFVATIPSWLNEKSPRVQVASVISWANFAATAQFLVVSVPAALVLANLPGANLLAVIGRGSLGPHSGQAGHTVYFWKASQIMVYIFPIANILTSIPVFSIIIRYNLLQMHGFRVPVIIANLFSVVLPWVVALPFCVGDSLALIINWSSAILFTIMNFVLPLAGYLAQCSLESRGVEPLEVKGGGLEGESATSAAPRGVAGYISSFLSKPEDRLLREASLSLLAGTDSEVGVEGGILKESGGGLFSNSLNSPGGPSAWVGSSEENDGLEGGGSIVSPLPFSCCGGGVGGLRRSERVYAWIFLFLSVAVTLLSIGLQSYVTTLPAPSGDDDDSSYVLPSCLLAWRSARQFS